MRKRLAQTLAESLGERFSLDAPLASYTTFEVGGPAWGLARPTDEQQLALVVTEAAKAGVPLQVIGAGSNLLISDGGLDALVVLMRDAFDEIEVEQQEDDDVRLYVGAGCPLQRAVDFCTENAWSGLEFAAGIPGNVGGALRMNAGTREGEMYGITESVKLMLADASAQWLDRSDINYSYREVILPEGAIILGCRMNLSRGDKQAISEKVQAMLSWREERHPQYLPCAGSVFRNPPAAYAAKLIERAGLKGVRHGGAQVSEQHANFIVNSGWATAEDIYELIGIVRARVREAFGITLECEVRVLGEFQ